jgi:hypothetical protein
MIDYLYIQKIGPGQNIGAEHHAMRASRNRRDGVGSRRKVRAAAAQNRL